MADQGRQRCRTSPFDHHPDALHVDENGGGDVLIAHRDEIVNVLLHEREGEIPALDGDAISDGLDGAQFHHPTSLARQHGRGGLLGLDTDDTNGWA